MSDEPAVFKVLRSRFKRQKVAELDELCRALAVSSRTVYRLLERVGYHSSYSHAGRFYTLVGIPRFDVFGLWHHEDVGFSTHGTLRATAISLVERSEAGHTHQELEAILGLRTHDTLRMLVGERLISRHEIGAVFVYVSAKASVAKRQIASRRARLEPPPIQALPITIDAVHVIEVLLAVIQRPGADAAEIAASVTARGAVLTVSQVEDIFRHYRLEKKVAGSRSRPSRR